MINFETGREREIEREREREDERERRERKENAKVSLSVCHQRLSSSSNPFLLILTKNGLKPRLTSSKAALKRWRPVRALSSTSLFT